MGNAAGGMEGAAARESRDPRAPGPAAVSAAAAATPTRPPPPARQPMPAADELEERFSRVLVSPGEAAVLPGLFSAFPPPPSHPRGVGRLLPLLTGTASGMPRAPRCPLG